MKSLLKYVKGGLKLSLLALPFTLTAAGIGILVGVPIATLQKSNELYDEVRNTEIVQEIIQQEQDRVEEAFNSGTMSMEDYYDSKDYIKSNKFIDDVVKNNAVLNDYEGKLHNANLSCLYSLLFAVPAAPGMYGLLSLYSSLSEEYGVKKYKRILKSAKEDFEEAKEIKKMKKTEKELKDYSEEIM